MKLLFTEGIDEIPNNSNLVGLWCSHSSKLLNERKNTYHISDADTGGAGGNWHTSMSGINQQFYEISSGFTNL